MRRKREKTLPEVLGEYAQRSVARFHAPGHKGRGIPMYESLSGWDVAQLPAMDRLHAPTGAIRKTQAAYAKAYGARDCFLLINGGTAGVQAMLLSLGQNKRVLMARDCRLSAVSGVALAGHTVDFIYPEPGGMVTPQAVEQALQKQAADAVIITSPNALGWCADVKGIAEAAHGHGALLLLDASYAAHFPFAASLPSLYPKAVDMFCVGTYRTLNAFMQSALLFTGQRCPIEAAQVQSTLSLLQSDSPSYPLMASLDWALHTAKDWEAHAMRMKLFQKRMSVANGVTVQTDSIAGAQGIFAVDPTKLVLDVHKRGITGFSACAALYAKGVVAEAADTDRLCFVTTPQDPQDWFDRLYEGVCTLSYGAQRAPQPPYAFPPCERAASVRDAVFGETAYIPLSQAAGRIAACAVGCDPLGAVMLFPGDVIPQESVDALLAHLRAGGTVCGMKPKECVCVLR